MILVHFIAKKVSRHRIEGIKAALPMIGLMFCLIHGGGCSPAPQGEPAICAQAPGVPVPGSGFNMCGGPSTAFSTPPPASAMRFAVTANHAIWWDQAPVDEGNALFFVEHGGSCSSITSQPKEIIGSNATEAVDAVTNESDPSVSHVYFDTPGLELKGAMLPANASFTPVQGAAEDQMYPGGGEAPMGFAWQEDFDIWFCRGRDCSGGRKKVTDTTDRETRPRTYRDYVVWENETTGQVVLGRGPQFTPVVIDQGAQPDVRRDWVVYAKREPSPDPACEWTEHWQLWAYGPLSSNPRTMRLSDVAYWGAADYIEPRLTDSYVVFLVNYLHHPKTVVGIYPISAFGRSNVAMLEVDDNGGIGGDVSNVDAWEDGSGTALVLYREGSSNKAKLRCCQPSGW